MKDSYKKPKRVSIGDENIDATKNPKMYPKTDVVPFIQNPLLSGNSTDDEMNQRAVTMQYKPKRSRTFVHHFTYEETRERNKLGLPAATIF